MANDPTLRCIVAYATCLFGLDLVEHFDQLVVWCDQWLIDIEVYAVQVPGTKSKKVPGPSIEHPKRRPIYTKTSLGNRIAAAMGEISNSNIFGHEYTGGVTLENASELTLLTSNHRHPSHIRGLTQDGCAEMRHWVSHFLFWPRKAATVAGIGCTCWPRVQVTDCDENTWLLLLYDIYYRSMGMLARHQSDLMATFR